MVILTNNHMAKAGEKISGQQMRIKKMENYTEEGVLMTAMQSMLLFYQLKAALLGMKILIILLS